MTFGSRKSAAVSKSEEGDPRFKYREEFLIPDRIINDFSLAARFHKAQGAKKSELMGNRALILTEHQAKIGHAHFGNT